MHLIEPAKGCDNPLVDLGADPLVFDNLEVFVLAGLLYSSKPVAGPPQDASTLRDNGAENQGSVE